MAIIYTDDTHYKNIADAIRAKNGTATKYMPSDMSAAIESIKTPSAGTVWAYSNLNGANKIYYANGIWVAVTDNGIYYSTDGMNWEQSNITTGRFYLAYNANGIWVAGSEDNGLYYSTDGMTWTQGNLTSDNFECVYNANGIWVAGNEDNGLYYSITWEP